MAAVQVCADDPIPAPGQPCIALSWEQYAPSPFHLDLESAGEIASAVLLIWALGWVIRTVIRLIPR